MTDVSPLLESVRSARRRLLLQHALEHASWGAVAGLAGFVLLLVAGTQILDWHWPVVLLVAAAGVSWYRGRRGVPDPYLTAQRLDTALGSHDTISTAYHYAAESPARIPDPGFLSELNERADAAARSLDAASVLPLRRPRAAVPLVLLAVAAGGVFALRYGILQTLDLRAPLAKVSFDTLTGAPTPPPPQKRGAPRPNVPQPEALFLPEAERASVEESELAQEEMLRQFELAANSTGRSGEGKDGRKSEAGAEGDEGAEDGEDSTGDDPNRPPGVGDPRRAQNEGPPPGKTPEKDSSLLEKMRDALANLMEKMKIEPQGADQQQMASNKKAGGQSGDGQKKQADRGSPTKGQPDAQGDPSDAQGDPDTDSQQAQDSSSPGQKSTDSPSPDQKSGVGQQDGRKDTELAEHAEAMGKLTELLGKRSQSLQGEIMVEVTNSRNQQARTPFEQRQAARGEGGDSARDEVPLHLQPYIQQFYEQVRRAPPAATKR